MELIKAEFAGGGGQDTNTALAMIVLHHRRLKAGSYCYCVVTSYTLSSCWQLNPILKYMTRPFRRVAYYPSCALQCVCA